MINKRKFELPPCYSLYWANIENSLLLNQRKVFDYLKIDLVQDFRDKKEHGSWIEEIIINSKDDIVVIADIDAFPIKREAYINGINEARRVGIFGLAQHSNLDSNNELYAGPMFLFIRRDLYFELGTPALSPTPKVDAAEIISILAKKAGYTPSLLFPTVTIEPKWSLGDRGVFGIGTFYGELEFFHLFESRMKSSLTLFESVANDIFNSNKLDFGYYIKIIKGNNSVIQKTKSFIERWPLWKRSYFL